MTSSLPAEPTREKRGALWSRLSLAWLLPLGAIVFAIAVLWSNWTDRGPLVHITFDEAGGVVADETRVRRNDVDVGTVEAVKLADDLDSVVIDVRLDPQIAPYLDDDARFWIVNARVNTTEISGLSTLLSGAYIGIDWDDTEGETRSDFVGFEEPPLTDRGKRGRRLTLNADEAGYIYTGSPVFFRQLEVGTVERRRLSGDAKQVLFDIFIEEPYHEHVYPESSFYGVTGVEGSLDADGFSVRLESLSAFFTGGVAFDNPDITANLEPVAADGATFRLHDNQRAAQESLFEGEEDDRFRYTARFAGSVKGLRRDAPIEFQGIRVGRVVNVSIELPDAPGLQAGAEVVLQLQPRRLGFADIEPSVFIDRLDRLVKSGLRVQLATGNLLTGSLIVKLVDGGSAAVPTDDDPADAGGTGPGALASIDRQASPYPELPTTASDIEAVTATVEQLVQKLGDLPIDELVSTATGLLGDVRALVASPEVEGLPARVASSFEAIEATASQVQSAADGLPGLVRSLTEASRNADDVLEGLSPDSRIYVELSATVRELRNAARSIAGFAELLEDNPNAVFTGRR